MGALWGRAAEEQPALHVVPEGLYQQGRDGVERAPAIQHRPTERIEVERAMDWSGASDARRGAGHALTACRPLSAARVPTGGQADETRYGLRGWAWAL